MAANHNRTPYPSAQAGRTKATRSAAVSAFVLQRRGAIRWALQRRRQHFYLEGRGVRRPRVQPQPDF